MDRWQTLHAFWSGFGLPAYDENTVDEGAEMPYITYEAAMGGSNVLAASLWYRDYGWQAISEKADQIKKQIGRGGQMIPYDDGGIWILANMPFATRMDEPSDSMVRRIRMSIVVDDIED